MAHEVLAALGVQVHLLLFPFVSPRCYFMFSPNQGAFVVYRS